MMTEGRAAGSQTLDRAMDLLFAAAAAPGGARMTDLAKACGLSSATAHRLLQALARRGLLEMMADSKRWVPGVQIFVLGARSAQTGGLLQAARASVLRVAAATGDCVFLMARAGFDAVCLDRQDGDYTIKSLTGGIGGATPLGLGTGSLAMLAHLPAAERGAVRAHNESRIEKLGGAVPTETEMAVIRARGFVYETSSLLPDVGSLAVPIRTRQGTPVGSLVIGAMQPRLEGARQEMALRLLQAEVACVEAELAQARSLVAHG